mmetsp:Transcript_62392/g.171388  ORF Transcript_62392/g.171388 Transcript_62392/m.171388 type:complete len:200 (+) Transcript_62392:356-955(+)
MSLYLSEVSRLQKVPFLSVYQLDRKSAVGARAVFRVLFDPRPHPCLTLQHLDCLVLVEASNLDVPQVVGLHQVFDPPVLQHHIVRVAAVVIRFDSRGTPRAICPIHLHALTYVERAARSEWEGQPRLESAALLASPARWRRRLGIRLLSGRRCGWRFLDQVLRLLPCLLRHLDGEDVASPQALWHHDVKLQPLVLNQDL